MLVMVRVLRLGLGGCGGGPSSVCRRCMMAVAVVSLMRKESVMRMWNTRNVV
jgi:hypothetical protein